jgi:hypothetical protein
VRDHAANQVRPAGREAERDRGAERGAADVRRRQVERLDQGAQVLLLVAPCPLAAALAVAVLATVVGDYEKDRAKPGTTGCQLRWSDQLPWTSTSGSPRPVSS